MKRACSLSALRPSQRRSRNGGCFDARRSWGDVPLGAAVWLSLLVPSSVAAQARTQSASEAAVAPSVAPVPPFRMAPAVIEQPSMTEAEIVRRWLASNRDVAALRAQLGASRFDIITASLWPNPTLSINFMGTPVGTPPDGRINVGAQVGFSLPVFGQISARIAAANAALSLAEVNVAMLLWARAADLRDAMVERAYADARLVVAERNLQEITRVLDIITRRTAAGTNAEYDRIRVQLALSTLRAARDNATIERARAESRLVALVGEQRPSPLPITLSGLAAFRGPEDLDALVAGALSRRPDIELARRGVRAAEASVRRWQSDAVPVPGVWLGAYATAGEPSLSVIGGLSLTLPTFDRNQGLIGRARAESQSGRELEEATRRRVVEEVRGAWEARSHAQQALDRFRTDALSVAEDLVRRAEATYQIGGHGSNTFSIVDLLDAYRTLWDAREQEVALQRTRADAEADLERAAALVTP
ncbi:MAG: TolC family protein [Polyangiales bacterium]